MFVCISMRGWTWMCCNTTSKLLHTFIYVRTLICCMLSQALHIYLQELCIKCHMLMKACHKQYLFALLYVGYIPWECNSVCIHYSTAYGYSYSSRDVGSVLAACLECTYVFVLCCVRRPIAGGREVLVWFLSSSALNGMVFPTPCLSASTPRMARSPLHTLALKLGKE